MTAFRRRRFALLALGVAAPVFTAALTTAAVLLNPHLDPATRYVSELGGHEAAHPAVFNGAMKLAGLAAAGLGPAFLLALRALGASRRAAWGVCALFMVAGGGLFLSAVFPWPDPRHLAVQAGLSAQLAPPLMAWSLRPTPGVARLRAFLWVTFAAMAAMALVNSGWMWAQALDWRPFARLVHDGNVGWWQRAYMLLLAVWVAVAALALERRLAREAQPSA